MSRIPDRSPSHSIGFRLFNKLFHHMVTCNHADSIMGIHNYSRRGFFDYFHLSHRQQSSLLYPVQINRFKSVAPMTFYASSVRLKKHIRTYLCIFLRYSVTLKCICNKIIHKFPRNKWSFFYHIILYDPNIFAWIFPFLPNFFRVIHM